MIRCDDPTCFRCASVPLVLKAPPSEKIGEIAERLRALEISRSVSSCEDFAAHVNIAEVE